MGEKLDRFIFESFSIVLSFIRLATDGEFQKNIRQLVVKSKTSHQNIQTDPCDMVLVYDILIFLFSTLPEME
jgi:hypothetical protein